MSNINVLGTLNASTEEGILAKSSQIYDDEMEMTQDEINESISGKADSAQVQTLWNDMYGSPSGKIWGIQQDAGEALTKANQNFANITTMSTTVNQLGTYVSGLNTRITTLESNQSSSITIDDALSSSSENPVQNKVINSKLVELESSIDDECAKKSDFLVDSATYGESVNIIKGTVAQNYKVVTALGADFVNEFTLGDQDVCNSLSEIKAIIGADYANSDGEFDSTAFASTISTRLAALEEAVNALQNPETPSV